MLRYVVCAYQSCHLAHFLKQGTSGFISLAHRWKLKALYKFSINLFQGASKISPVLKTKDKFMVVGIILDQRCS